MTLDLVVLGNLLLDDVVHADGHTRMAQPGGAVLHTALAARLSGIDVGIVTVRGDDYPSWMLEAMSARGISLEGVRPLGGPGLRTWLLYEGCRRRVIHRLDGPSHTEVSPTVEDIPASWQARAAHLAPMPIDIQRRILTALTTDTLISVDPYEILTEANVEVWRGLLKDVDIFFVSEDELAIAAALEDPKPFLSSLAPTLTTAKQGLRLVALKRGARGGLLWDARKNAFLEWSGRATQAVDPTGAGDAFAGGFLAGCLKGEPIPRALQRATVAASFALEGSGADGLLAASREKADYRLSDWYGTSTAGDLTRRNS